MKSISVQAPVEWLGLETTSVGNLQFNKFNNLRTPENAEETLSMWSQDGCKWYVRKMKQIKVLELIVDTVFPKEQNGEK